MYELLKAALVQVNGLQKDLSLVAIVEELERNPNYPSSELADWLKEEGMGLMEQLATSSELMNEKWQQFIMEQRAIMPLVVEAALETEDGEYFNDAFMHTVFYAKMMSEQLMLGVVEGFTAQLNNKKQNEWHVEYGVEILADIPIDANSRLVA